LLVVFAGILDSDSAVVTGFDGATAAARKTPGWLFAVAWLAAVSVSELGVLSPFS
jgi:hypothetical protein